MAEEAGSGERHRLDHWLKLVCIYKQRSESTAACSSGHVKINGVRARPASPLRINDVVEITGVRQRKLVVLGLPAHSISKEQAREMYRDETPPPPPKDWVDDIPRRDRGTGRPTKKDRRAMDNRRV